jgi:hypothetical protein
MMVRTMSTISCKLIFSQLVKGVKYLGNTEHFRLISQMFKDNGHYSKLMCEVNAKMSEII